ncbi:MAG: hypothetical protein K6L75_09910 [Cellvibrionaceae bacterium]
MTSLTFIRKHRVWVFIALLAHSVQSLASVGSQLMMQQVPQGLTSSDCHSEDIGMSIESSLDVSVSNMPLEISVENQNVQDMHGVMDCCDKDCDMKLCHTNSAILSEIIIPAFKLDNNHIKSYTKTSLLFSIDTQYRPPILG